MLINRKDRVTKPFVGPTGERVYELVGRSADTGRVTMHSFAHDVISPGGYSKQHYHPEAEETYAILKGKGKMIIDGTAYLLAPGDILLVHPHERHQIFTEGNDDLEFYVVCAPAWEPTNSVYIDK